MTRGVIALDIDGTVVLEDGTPSPGVKEAVDAAVDAGYDVTLSTGRSWHSTEPILRMLELTPEYVVCANGASIHKRRGDGSYERFHVETFDPSTALAALREHLPDAQYMVELADETRLHTGFVDFWNTSAGDEVTFEQLSERPVCRIVVVSPDHEEAEFSRIIEGIGLHQVAYSIGWTAWLDIAPEGIDKGTGLDKVHAWLGVDPSLSIVMGDGRNDLGMFAWARENGGRAIAMGQAPDDVKNAASEVTGDVASGGVAQILAALPGI